MTLAEVVVADGLAWSVVGIVLAGLISLVAWLVKKMVDISSLLSALAIAVRSLEDRVERIEAHEDAH